MTMFYASKIEVISTIGSVTSKDMQDFFLKVRPQLYSHHIHLKKGGIKNVIKFDIISEGKDI